MHGCSTIGTETLPSLPTETPPPLIPEINKIYGGISKVRVELENWHSMDIYDIKCSINVSGGMFGMINIHDEITIPVMKKDEILTIETETKIFGLGVIDIDVKVSNNESCDSEGDDGTIFLIFLCVWQ